MEGLLGRQLNDVESKFAPERIFYSGSMGIPLSCPRVSIIGSRDAADDDALEARKITRKLVENRVIIVSGLARGIDAAAHNAAIEHSGKTIAVIGTPLDKTYPKEHIDLQEDIMKNHLAISQYPVGHSTTPKDFVLRNRTMALISDATVIVKAGESSGSLHQGWETLRIGRPLFIHKQATRNNNLMWPQKMIKYGAMMLEDPSDILENIPSNVKMPKLFS